MRIGRATRPARDRPNVTSSKCNRTSTLRAVPKHGAKQGKNIHVQKPESRRSRGLRRSIDRDNVLVCYAWHVQATKPKPRWNLPVSTPPVVYQEARWWRHTPRRGQRPCSAPPSGSAAATWAAGQPWSASHSACHRSRSRGVGARYIRSRTVAASNGQRLSASSSALCSSCAMVATLLHYAVPSAPRTVSAGSTVALL